MVSKLWNSFLLLCIFLGAGSISNRAVAGSIVRSDKSCVHVGLIVESTDSVRGELCRGDRLVLDGKTLINCKYRPSFRWLTPGQYDIDKICPSLRQYTGICGDQVLSSCFRNRNQSQIKLIGNAYKTTPGAPKFRWRPVDDASGYEVILKSFSGEIKRFMVTDPSLTLDTPLDNGEFMEVHIYALGTKISGKFAYHVLSIEDLSQLNQAIEVIKNQPFSEIDEALYLDSLYTSNGLLDEAISVLEASLSQPTLAIKRRLAHRYLDGGYIERARQMFERISKYSNEGTPERIEADTFLQSQLPTSTNPPQ